MRRQAWHVIESKLWALGEVVIESQLILFCGRFRCSCHSDVDDSDVLVFVEQASECPPNFVLVAGWLSLEGSLDPSMEGNH